MPFPIDKCPKCGNDEFYITQKISGTGFYNYKLNGDQENCHNGEMHDGLRYTRISKYAYCNNCFKRLFKITDDMGI